MLQKGGERDHRRAAVWFIKWWREEGGLISASSTPRLLPQATTTTSGASAFNSGAEGFSLESPLTIPERTGWGFDFEWDVSISGNSDPSMIQARMEEKIEIHARELEQEKLSRNDVSLTQEKKLARDEKIARRRARGKVRN